MAKQTIAELAVKVHELGFDLRTTRERLENQDRDADELAEIVERQREELVAARQEIAVLRQRLDEQVRRIDTWDTRVWGLIVLMAGALLSLASGLIVALVRK